MLHSDNQMIFMLSLTIFRYYAPALGFLMFAVGVNSSEKDFLEAFNRPAAILAGYVGQFLVKPILGFAFGSIAMTIFGLPTSLGKCQPVLQHRKIVSNC